MLKIGLTGGIGSGKTTVASMFRQLGAPVVDADVISHRLSGEATVTARIRSLFGDSVLHADGTLNRKRLASTVFADPQARQQLESLLHPLVRQAMVQAVESIDYPYVILAVPLLLETDFHRLVDRILVVDVPEAVQLERVRQRDGRSEAQIRSIMQQQIPRRQRLQRADDIIDNTADETQLQTAVAALHQQYRQLAAG